MPAEKLDVDVTN